MSFGVVKMTLEKEILEECNEDCNKCHFHCCPYEELNNP
jgi:hypothetical protein